MAHELAPHLGQSFLSLNEVISRLRCEFAQVTVDRQAGSDVVGDMIAAWCNIKAAYRRWREPPSEAARLDQLIDRFSVLRDQAVLIGVCDDPASEFGYIDFTAVPGEPLLVAYCCEQHEDAARPFVARIAAVLNYTVTLR
jgi:hypothetical protein